MSHSTESAIEAVTRQDILETAALIGDRVRRTPVVGARLSDFGSSPGGGDDVVFKLEFLQHSGSFKARGGFANLMRRDVPEAGVVAASGGNHGAAVAYAARALGVPCHIFVPTVSSPAKIERIERYGATLHVTGERYADALAASEGFLAETGAMAVHAYDQPETLMGQGTVAHEFVDQAAVDTILVATGGGGLIGGMAAYLRGTTKLISVEPETAPTLHRALAAGHPVDAPAGGIAADSLAPRQVGTLMFPLAQAYVDRAVLVPDEAIRTAQRALWETLRVVTEPGGAAAFAALLGGAYVPEAGERVGVVLCGANSTAVDFG